MIKINYFKCFGCGACSLVCPTKALKIKKNEEGFYKAFLVGKCVGCNKCNAVCPIDKEVKPNEFKKEAYSLCARDNNEWVKSSSGGAFAALCKTFVGKEVAIFGATIEKKNVFHKYVNNIYRVGDFSKSKYVQSDLKNTLYEAKQYLEKGYYVVWSGTPCQCHALKMYLGRDYENLFVIDLICHGVGSVDVFNDYIIYLENKYKKSITDYTFRYKDLRFKSLPNYSSLITFQNGRKRLILNDKYNQLFLSQLILNKTCSNNCPYRNENRLSDITLGDLKGKEAIFPDSFYDFKNYSTVIINTERGKNIFNNVNKENYLIEKISLTNIEKFNPLFFRSTKGNSTRDKVMNEYKEHGFDYIVDKYTRKPSPRIKALLPYRLKSFAKRLFGYFHL